MCTLKNVLQSRDPNKHNDITEKPSYIKLNSETAWERRASRQSVSAWALEKTLLLHRARTEMLKAREVPQSKSPQHSPPTDTSWLRPPRCSKPPLPILAKKDRLVPTAKMPHCDPAPGSGGLTCPCCPREKPQKVEGIAPGPSLEVPPLNLPG